MTDHNRTTIDWDNGTQASSAIYKPMYIPSALPGATPSRSWRK